MEVARYIRRGRVRKLEKEYDFEAQVTKADDDELQLCAGPTFAGPGCV
jgi:hypothetical protein